MKKVFQSQEECMKEFKKEVNLKPQHFMLKIKTLKHIGGKEFIKKTKPEYAVIMSGRSNIFSFPSKEILERLINNNITVYCTKYNYTITLKIKNKKCIFSTMKEIIK